MPEIIGSNVNLKEGKTDDSQFDLSPQISGTSFPTTNRKFLSLKTMPKPIYSIIEVRAHNKTDDCWTIVDGYVYDITKILKTHSGGFSKIFQVAGSDGTQMFQEGHFAVDSRHFLSPYEIGICEDYIKY
ncbi:cytochrome b5 [Stylonychia lemnae]|uniref:Cytochrome b5 n=1 Tax=Stylonychia lemnae TaxID=5949 RepID=A0A078B0Z8_STYLE|nr:cytochrome b5 [Stylonychia lemnae]|eukprot:CDW87027.1 cytochrome b5 [Stylonychia lemnae]